MHSNFFEVPSSSCFSGPALHTDVGPQIAGWWWFQLIFTLTAILFLKFIYSFLLICYYAYKLLSQVPSSSCFTGWWWFQFIFTLTATLFVKFLCCFLLMCLLACYYSLTFFVFLSWTYLLLFQVPFHCTAIMFV